MTNRFATDDTNAVRFIIDVGLIIIKVAHACFSIDRWLCGWGNNNKKMDSTQPKNGFCANACFDKVAIVGVSKFDNLSKK